MRALGFARRTGMGDATERRATATQPWRRRLRDLRGELCPYGQLLRGFENRIGNFPTERWVAYTIRDEKMGRLIWMTAHETTR